MDDPERGAINGNAVALDDYGTIPRSPTADDRVHILEEDELVSDLVYFLWSSDAIWRRKSGSVLVQAMAWRRQATGHYLN